MTNVFPFHPKPPAPQIRITAGTVTASTHLPDVGRFMFFLTFIDTDGSHAGVWDGYSHEDALAAAREWQRDGVSLFDETVANVQ